ncbi:MAG: NADH:flavin oxidoreductase/NADH oxidase [Thermomicrobiales bacterium]|nr:NADH:flavin oxidoreductase/NADH oxidase [Thermomicrobiales bacterium]MCO5225812.1 NADH:flavin oxidoreductase/NADH oxidase [Thermomicrobiales bacterium]
MARLLEPIDIRGLHIPNRIWVAPMCQYSCFSNDGIVDDWHLVHLGAFAQGGFGLIITEASAVNPVGRISPQDAGIWNDDQRDAWKRIVDFVHTQGATIGIQLAHAGRKAGTYSPFSTEGKGVVPHEMGGWTPVGPTTVPFPGYASSPEPLDDAGIKAIIEDFRAAAIRARDAGFDVLEIHAAHGYLLHEFYSPITNTRTDDWGGDFAGRTRLTVAVTDAIREVWDGPLFVRISATDWVEGGWTIEDSVQLAQVLKTHGVDLIDTSSGSNIPVDIPLGPGYQVPLAQRIHDEVDIVVGTVGLITDPEQAESILVQDQADAILLGRVALREPHWPQRAAVELGIATDNAPYAPQHVRGAWPKREDG